MAQFIKFDELGQKVNKLTWDDFSLNPMDLIEAIWREVPDFRERYELPVSYTHLDVYKRQGYP